MTSRRTRAMEASTSWWIRHRFAVAFLCALTFLVLLAIRPGDETAPKVAPPPAASRAPPLEDPGAIYARAELRWPAAYLFKPDDRLRGRVEFDLAPLVLGRAPEADPGARERHAFGAVTVTADRIGIDLSKPTVYYGESTAILRGREYRQLRYRWWYSAPPSTSSRASSAEPGQGFRMTLDDTGRAAIWEVLADVSRARLIFVATPLEKAAREEFGEPLPGRRYAIEASAAEAPDVIVPRVIEPGPERFPMGPFLYLDDPSHSVLTLICRCMEAQFESLAGDTQYELRPLSELEARGLDARGWTADLPRRKGGGETFDEAEDPGWLERCLRLPEI